MRIRAENVLGILLALVGAVTWIHPAFSYRVSQNTEQVAGARTILEVRRVIHFPLWFSIAMVTIGVALFIIGLRQD
ncbi:MAG TPA: hypothetical protein VGR81_13670 [Candidatus Acidoferrales bacterium]|nr:hypothetical protein [Candidatus Acidoferrales bacterium]